MRNFKYPRSDLIDGVRINRPEYDQYHAVLRRCSGSSTLRNDYLKNSIHPDWLDFDNYMDWATRQIGFLNREYSSNRLWSLDKDILGNFEYLYSPDTCIFVPSVINQFFSIARGNSTGKYLLGVSIRKDRKNKIFKSSVSNPLDLKRYRLGCFHTELEAHQAYIKLKQKFANQLADQYSGKVDDRVIERLLNFSVWLEKYKLHNSLIQRGS